MKRKWIVLTQKIWRIKWNIDFPTFDCTYLWLNCRDIWRTNQKNSLLCPFECPYLSRNYRKTQIKAGLKLRREAYQHPRIFSWYWFYVATWQHLPDVASAFFKFFWLALFSWHWSYVAALISDSVLSLDFDKFLWLDLPQEISGLTICPFFLGQAFSSLSIPRIKMYI